MTKKIVPSGSYEELDSREIENLWIDDLIEKLIKFKEEGQAKGYSYKLDECSAYGLEFEVYRLETDNEYQKRLDKEEKEKAKKEKKEYETFLKLKQKFEGS